MAYIGKGIENLSDRAVLDNITASATATYNLLLNGVAYVPSSAESLTVSLNGVIQKPQSSYTVSGSTIVFDSALTSSDSIDFILAERAITLTTVGSGSVGTSQLVDANVTTAKIADSAVTNAKITDGTIANAKLANSSITLNGSAVSLGGSATISGGGGKIAQVVYQNFTSVFTTTSATYADTGLTLSITPTASDSTLYITAIMNGVTHNGVSFASCKMFEDSTELEEWSGVSGYADNTSNSVTLCLQRSASSTSARTYKIQMANKPNTGGTLRINNRVASGESCQSNMMIMEVLA